MIDFENFYKNDEYREIRIREYHSNIFVDNIISMMYDDQKLNTKPNNNGLGIDFRCNPDFSDWNKDKFFGFD